MERGIFRLRRPTSPYVTTPAKMAVASGRGVCGRESSAARLTDREGGVLLELADELALRLLLIREEGEDFRHDCCEGGVGRWSRCGTVTQPADQEELLIRGRGRTVERRDCGSEKQGTCVRSQNRLANVCVDALVMRSTSGERQQDSARRRVQEGQERRAAQARRSTSRTTEKDERQRAAREREREWRHLSVALDSPALRLLLQLRVAAALPILPFPSHPFPSLLPRRGRLDGSGCPDL